MAIEFPALPTDPDVIAGDWRYRLPDWLFCQIRDLLDRRAELLAIRIYNSYEVGVCFWLLPDVENVYTEHLYVMPPGAISK